MNRYNIPFSEFKESVDQIDDLEKKIEFISQNILDENQFVFDIKQAIGALKIEEIRISTFPPSYQEAINEMLRSDEELRNRIAKDNYFLLSELLCEKGIFFVEQAKLLLKQFVREYKIQIKINVLNESLQNAEKIFPEITKIIWKESEFNLLELFRVLHTNEIIPFYEKEEILAHFMNEKLQPFSKNSSTVSRFIWQDSDSSFAVFVNELAGLGVIINENKYKNLSAHFLNRNGEYFKNLAQKRSYKELSQDTGSFIREILSFLKKRK